MKKYIIASLLALSLFGAGMFYMPSLAQATHCDAGFEHANGDPNSPLCVPKSQVTGGFANSKTVGEFLLQVIRILLILSAVVAILFIIIGGFRYMTSSGNQENADKGKKMITNAVIGLIVIVLSYTIVNVVLRTVTTGNVIGPGNSNNGGIGTTCPNGEPPNPRTGQCGS